jgi:hypothetical protein
VSKPILAGSKKDFFKDRDQGDQIGRKFAQLVIVYLGLAEVPRIFSCVLHSIVKFTWYTYVQLSRQKRVGLHSGRFFYTNSSGHPDRDFQNVVILTHPNVDESGAKK